MRLSELRKELAGWAYYTGAIDPEVFVRVGNAKAPLSCIELGDLWGREPIVIGSWSQPGEEDDIAIDMAGNGMVDPSME